MGEVAELAEGSRLLSGCGGKTPPRVRIPASPPRNLPKQISLMADSLWHPDLKDLRSMLQSKFHLWPMTNSSHRL